MHLKVTTVTSHLQYYFYNYFTFVPIIHYRYIVLKTGSHLILTKCSQLL